MLFFFVPEIGSYRGRNKIYLKKGYNFQKVLDINKTSTRQKCSNHLTAWVFQSDGKNICIIRIMQPASTAERLGLTILQVLFKIFSPAKGYSWQLALMSQVNLEHYPPILHWAVPKAVCNMHMNWTIVEIKFLIP